MRLLFASIFCIAQATEKHRRVALCESLDFRDKAEVWEAIGKSGAASPLYQSHLQHLLNSVK
jgi:hypothetical protein